MGAVNHPQMVGSWHWVSQIYPFYASSGKILASQIAQQKASEWMLFPQIWVPGIPVVPHKAVAEVSKIGNL